MQQTGDQLCSSLASFVTHSSWTEASLTAKFTNKIHRHAGERRHLATLRWSHKLCSIFSQLTTATAAAVTDSWLVALVLTILLLSVCQTVSVSVCLSVCLFVRLVLIVIITIIATWQDLRGNCFYCCCRCRRCFGCGIIGQLRRDFRASASWKTRTQLLWLLEVPLQPIIVVVGLTRSKELKLIDKRGK